ncbi:hypothetical protein C8J56DRAFT_1042502 [Mycena floridula]|nr:hypothetical protein C8J56DRAFT_1042502 [Mycena floridula]
MSDPSQSGPLAAADIGILKKFLIEIAIQFMVYGISSTLAVIALYKLWRKKIHLVARHILVLAIIIMFLGSTVNIVAGLALDLIELSQLSFDPPDNGKEVVGILLFGNAMIRFNYIISDSIVVWRTWVLWPDSRRVRYLLILCLLGTLAGASIDYTFLMLYLLYGNTRFVPEGPQTLVLTLPLCLTNLVSTLLMGYKVWQYRTEIKKNIGIERNKRTQVEWVLILLTESGAIYFLLWLFSIFFAALNTENFRQKSIAYELIVNLTPQLTAIYPIIIILLVATDKANQQSCRHFPGR